MKTVTINLQVNTEADLQQLTGLYSGILAGVSMQKDAGILNQLATCLEAELMKLYSPEQWEAVRAEIDNQAQKAASVAQANVFDDLTIE
jgi:hypothetical protein